MSAAAETISIPGSPCQACGACCAAYRVTFYWSEGRGLPQRLMRKVNPWFACMAGTDQPAVRCAALEGTVGGAVACTVHGERPSPCRELQPGGDKCERARARHGLAPLP